MNLSELRERLDGLVEQAQAEFSRIDRQDDLVVAKNGYLGRKGLLKDLGAQMGKVSAEDRPVLGKEINRVKAAIEAAFGVRQELLTARARAEALARGSVDVTLPGRGAGVGGGHPLIQIESWLIDVFRSMGFDVASGPEIENDFHNFEALNFPHDHPARDMQDTFFAEPLAGRDDLVLRTHTSPVQIRTMLRYAPPVRIIAPGVVYRYDDDKTHSPVFRQIECLHVDHGITLAHLKGTLTHFLQKLFGNVALRFRPSFFPFTEPSAEVDVTCIFCRGEGCSICSHTGWIEILGSGMVDPKVYKSCGYDAEGLTGYAFGLGVERVAMLTLGIPDIRLFYENDLRFLDQF